MTGPIIFADETARRQLLDCGRVVTFRSSRRTTGSTWFRYSRTGPKQGDVLVEEIGPVRVERDELESYANLSGFESVDDWIDAIHDLNGDVETGFVYHVGLVDVERGVEQ